jgi:hypothetical protein
MRASVNAAKSSGENFGWCVPASSDAWGGAAETLEDRLGQASNAAVAAIRICVIMKVPQNNGRDDKFHQKRFGKSI